LDNSLARLQTNYIDLYQIHRFDKETPIEETMEALHDCVKSGKVRYIGASSMPAWLFAKCQYTAEMKGWTKFVSMQNHYNLVYREEEREMNPLCLDLGVGLIPWSPLARGFLCGSRTPNDKKLMEEKKVKAVPTAGAASTSAASAANAPAPASSAGAVSSSAAAAAASSTTASTSSSGPAAAATAAAAAAAEASSNTSSSSSGKEDKQGSQPTTRTLSDAFSMSLYYLPEDFQIVDRVVELAKRKNKKPAQIALAWLLNKPGVVSPIIGATKLSHLDDAAEAMTIKLDEGDMKFLEELYKPHKPG